MPHDALLTIGLLIVVAKLAEGILRQLRLNSIIAYAATGVLLGPVLGVIEVTDDLHVLLNLGIFVFFFLIGLDEIDIHGFVTAMRGRFFVAATLSVLISLVVSLTATSDVLFDLGLGLDFSGALALAGILSLSSLGLVAKVLSDDGMLRRPIGIQIFTTVIIAELLALLVVGFTIGEHATDVSLLGVATLLAQIAGFAVVTWMLSRYVVPRLMLFLQRFLNVPQLSFGLLLGGLFLVVLAAENFGLHGTLGALLFGAALSGIPYQVRRDIIPGMRSTAEGLFVPLFFASAGLHLSLSFTTLPITVLAVLVLVPLVGKFAGAFIGAYVVRLDSPFALATGLLAKGVAEIALLLVILEAGIIGTDIFSLLVVVMFGYILLMPPPIISFAVTRAKPSEDAVLPTTLPASLSRFALDEVKVGDIVDRTRMLPDASMSVRSFVDAWVVPHQQDYVVIADDGNLAGIVSLGMLRYLPKEAWSQTPLRQVLRHNAPRAGLERTGGGRPATHGRALAHCAASGRRGLRTAPGMVTSQDVLEMLVVEAKGGS